MTPLFTWSVSYFKKSKNKLFWNVEQFSDEKFEES